jgi:hypothetical protein
VRQASEPAGGASLHFADIRQPWADSTKELRIGKRILAAPPTGFALMEFACAQGNFCTIAAPLLGKLRFRGF